MGIVGGFMVLPYNHPKWRFLVSKMECFDSWRNKYPNMESYLGRHGKNLGVRTPVEQVQRKPSTGWLLDSNPEDTAVQRLGLAT